MHYRIAAMPAALGLSAMLLSAQEAGKDLQVEVRSFQAGAVGGSTGMISVAPQAATFQFIAAEPGLFGKAVTGAPYSGEGFTEMTQTLADGTRITNKHSKKVWRDSQGRTREESTLAMLGPWAAQGGTAPRLITIADPVSKTVYTLNDQDKTAFRRKMGDSDAMMAKLAAEAKASGKAMMYRREEHAVELHEAPGIPGPMPGAGIAVARAFRMGDGAKEELLGTQIMEGLKVEGKRETSTIKAGEIGNDRELVSVTERWTSADLQVLMRMTTKDPQMGETTYRLTNLSRTEPAATLFQVPADYTINDAPGPMHFERRIETK